MGQLEGQLEEGEMIKAAPDAWPWEMDHRCLTQPLQLIVKQKLYLLGPSFIPPLRPSPP